MPMCVGKWLDFCVKGNFFCVFGIQVSNVLLPNEIITYQTFSCIDFSPPYILFYVCHIFVDSVV